MNDPKAVNELLDALKYASSERLKAAQRKFTVARNTITSDALSYSYKPFFSTKEQEVLEEAARILGDFKNKIEHAKEIRAREERKEEEHLKHCQALREKYLNEYFPSPKTAEEHLETVLFHLSLQDNKDKIARGSYFIHGLKYIESDLANGLNEQYSHLKVKHVAIECQRETRVWISENLWRYNAVPDKERITTVINVYINDWRTKTENRYRDFLSRYKEALRMELDQEAAKVRAQTAKQRRSEIKVVK